VIYQVYPRSFCDADGDGVGDLRGIIGKVDYLRGLGISAVWLSPVQPSPMVDFGYDITDYRGIDPLFGTMADFDDLLEALHAVGIRLILDFVPNHTAGLHLEGLSAPAGDGRGADAVAESAAVGEQDAGLAVGVVDDELGVAVIDLPGFDAAGEPGGALDRKQ
jgi:glycosidase